MEEDRGSGTLRWGYVVFWGRVLSLVHVAWSSLNDGACRRGVTPISLCSTNEFDVSYPIFLLVRDFI